MLRILLTVLSLFFQWWPYNVAAEVCKCSRLGSDLLLFAMQGTLFLLLKFHFVSIVSV